jgi:NAD(P)-dependent dehydrogenase (short-subunit alcohol dehydrogenase family)
MIATATERFGRLDILVNNAGIRPEPAPFHEQDDATFDRIVAVNLKGMFMCMKHAISAMLRTGGGTIVNIASIGRAWTF